MSLNHHLNLTLNHLHASSSSSFRLFPLQDDDDDDQGAAYAHQFIESKPSLQPLEVVGDVSLERKKEITNTDLNLTILKNYNYNKNDQDHNNNGRSSNDYGIMEEDQNSKRVVINNNVSGRESKNGEDSSSMSNRACSDCGTTRTPLWRSGPHGPKSLCNACGIRQRKARRAAAAMTSSDTTCATNCNNTNTNTSTKLNLFKELGAPKIMKKRSKNHATKPMLTPPANDNDNDNDNQSSQTTKRICFQELSKNLSLHQFFPQDEKDAAILLMALSSGFVEG